MYMEWKKNREIEINILFQLIENTHNIKKLDLISKSRKKECVSARRDFMNILFETFEIEIEKQEDIASLIKRSRISFIHHRKKHLIFYSNYKDYKQQYDNIKEEFIEILKNHS